MVLKHESRIVRSYPDDALLEEVRRVAELVDKPVLTYSDFEKHAGISVSTMLRRFGKWRITLERAGLDHLFFGNPEGPNYSDEELLEKVQHASELVGKPVLTMANFTRHTGLSAEILCRRFGSWRSALERAGLGDMHYLSDAESAHLGRRWYSDEELIEELRRVAGLVKRQALMEQDFATYSKVVPVTLVLRFGCWRAALERAGLSHRYSREIEGLRNRFSDEESAGGSPARSGDRGETATHEEGLPRTCRTRRQHPRSTVRILARRA